MIPRAEKDVPSEGNPTTVVRHSSYADGECDGLSVHVWCPGCQEAHRIRFRCPEHGGPTSGPVWDGDPHSDPFSMEPSLLVSPGMPDSCHSFIRNGVWEFLGDSGGHELRGQVPMEPVPDWMVR